MSYGFLLKAAQYFPVKVLVEKLHVVAVLKSTNFDIPCNY